MHDDDQSKHLSIYDNAKSTNHVTTPDEDFRIFRQYMSPSRIGLGYFSDPEDDPQIPEVAISGNSPAINWNLETPILARNGARVHVSDGAIDYYIGYSVLSSSTPYGDNNSPTVGDKQHRAEIMPDLVCTKVVSHTGGGSIQTQSTCDCEIWGMHIFNTVNSQRLATIKNGDDISVIQVPIDTVLHPSWGSAGNVQTFTNVVHQMFKVPIFAKGGVKTLIRDDDNSEDTTGLHISLLIRELGTNNALTSNNTR
jgi:hypothetical protein